MARAKKAKGTGGSESLTRCAGCGSPIDTNSEEWAVFVKDGKEHNIHWGGEYGSDCVHYANHPEEALQ